MKKYKVYAMAIASKFIGEFEAESKEEAEELYVTIVPEKLN